MVTLRLVLLSGPSTFSQSRRVSGESEDFPCIRQCTSAPSTTRVSKSPDRASRSFFWDAVGAFLRNVTKWVSPDATGNGVASSTASISAAVRTNVVHSKPNSFSSADSNAFSIAARDPVPSKTTLPLLMWVHTSVCPRASPTATRRLIATRRFPRLTARRNPTRTVIPAP